MLKAAVLITEKVGTTQMCLSNNWRKKNHNEMKYYYEMKYHSNNKDQLYVMTQRAFVSQ